MIKISALFLVAGTTLGCHRSASIPRLPENHGTTSCLDGSLSASLFKGLGLPCPKVGEKLPANFNSLTKKVDGNCGEKNGFAESAELFEEVFSNRSTYRPVIQELYKTGFEDPFEERPEIKNYVTRLLKKFEPKTELDKASILFRAAASYYSVFRIEGKGYRGLALEDGGLSIHPSLDRGAIGEAPIRIKYGDVLPKELISADPKEREADCLEYSHLLISLLRAAGIQDAHVKREEIEKEPHAYVVAVLDGKKYKLDLLQNEFTPTTTIAGSDRESIAFHYHNEGDVFFMQGKLDEALKIYNRALEINPNNSPTLLSRGDLLARRGRLIEALESYNKALNVGGGQADDWNNKGVILAKLGRFTEALAAFNQALLLNPEYADAWHNKGNALGKQGKTEEANNCFRQEQEIRVRPRRVKLPIP